MDTCIVQKVGHQLSEETALPQNDYSWCDRPIEIVTAVCKSRGIGTSDAGRVSTEVYRREGGFESASLHLCNAQDSSEQREDFVD